MRLRRDFVIFSSVLYNKYCLSLSRGCRQIAEPRYILCLLLLLWLIVFLYLANIIVDRDLLFGLWEVVLSIS